MFKKGGNVFVAISMVLVFFCFASELKAATLSFASRTKTYKTGQTVIVTFNLFSSDQAVNALAATINYPTDLLDLTAVSLSGSIVNFWVEQPKKGLAGTVKMQGVIFNPGYKGKGAKLVTLTFKAKAPGSALVSVKDFQVLANDGKGTAVKTTNANLKLAITGTALKIADTTTITKPETVEAVTDNTKTVSMPSSFVLKSSTHPTQSAWYRGNVARLNWKLPIGTETVSYSLDRRAKTDPGQNSRGKVSSVAYQDLSDGTWYFHIKIKTKTAWSQTVHYRLNFDYTKPDLSIVVVQPSEGQLPTIKYFATDSGSGVDHYEISLDNGPIKRSAKSGSFTPGVVGNGSHKVTVTVYDKIGNKTIQSKGFRYWPLGMGE